LTHLSSRRRAALIGRGRVGGGARRRRCRSGAGPRTGAGGLLDDQQSTASINAVFDRASNGALKGTVTTFEIERDGALTLLDSDHDDSPVGGSIGFAGR